MKEKEDVPTKRFWELIEANAVLGQKHAKWDLYLTRIKASVQTIEDRMNRFERRQCHKPLIQQAEIVGEQKKRR